MISSTREDSVSADAVGPLFANPVVDHPDPTIRSRASW
jgi:hypothetical protein